MTDDAGARVRPDPFEGAEGVEPFVWTHDDGPAESEAQAAPPMAETRVLERDATWVADGAPAPDPASPLPSPFGGTRTAVAGRRRTPQAGLATGLVITLLVSGPILLVELNWRGAGVTAQPHYLWAAAFAAAALSFVAGGVVVGLAARSWGQAFLEGIALGLLSCGLLVLAALVRQMIVGQHLPRASTFLWFVIEVGVLVWCAAGGALLGRLFSLRSSGA